MPFMIASVECYSGYKANEHPVAFACEQRRHRVACILDRWYEGGTHSDNAVFEYFKVRTDRGEEFMLRYSPLFDAWGVCRCVIR